MSDESDVLLIGSGVAATLVAESLLQAKPSLSVKLLEAGPRFPLRDRRDWWDFVLGEDPQYRSTYDQEINTPSPESFSLGQTEWGFRESRVRAFGGSTMHWGGWSLRFKEEDFKAYTRVKRGADWPVSYAEIEPWYEKAEKALSVGGDNADEGPWRRNPFPQPSFPWSVQESFLAKGFLKGGLKPGHMPIARFARCMTTGTCKYCPIGSRYTAQDHLDSLAEAFQSFKIQSSATVLEILADGPRVNGVRYLDLTTGETREAYAGTIILAAGAYESPKILLRSVSPDWPNGLGNRHDQVGRYAVTHTMLRVRARFPENKDGWFQEYDFPTLMSRSWDTPERQKDGKVFLFNNRSYPRVDLAREMIFGKRRLDIDRVQNGTMYLGLDAFIEEFGDFSNTIRPGNATGKFGLPTTEVTFSRHRDLEAVAGKVLDEMGAILEKIGGTIDPMDRNGKRLMNPRGDHTSGTCRMGSDPSRSVTNANLKVHEVDNLYICSNAVFPTAAAVNPTLTLSALALRLGDHLVNNTGGSV